MIFARFLVVLFATACPALATTAMADERILDFHSDITVMSDGTMSVVENIRVQAEGRGIRRGIYRDFPTDYADRLGNRIRVGFELVDVRRDGVSEAHHTESRRNGVRIYAGSAGVLLDPGVYEYEIEYRTSRMLGHFDDHDELYWNVTGNGWDFTIDRASASVTLPDTVPTDEVRVEGYTGAFGSSGQDYVAQSEGSQIEIQTTGSLGPGQGLTLVVAWPRGHVAEPSPADNAAFLLEQNMGLLVALAGSLSALIYLLLAWFKVGRDPAPGVIFPRYEPPANYSPASLRYISKMRYDQRAFTAAVLSLAVKGLIRIDRSAKRYSLTYLDNPDKSDLAPGEKALLSQLFASGNFVELENENHAVVSAARIAHAQSLQKHHRQRNFAVNGRFLLPAIVLLVGTMAAIALLGRFTLAAGLALAPATVAVLVFAWLLKAPTALGRKLLDEVDGFRMYLEVAEKDELNLKNPPERTPELFESYLPYALALGVEQRWAERFASVLAQLEDERGRPYHPAWYTGRWDASNPSKMAKLVGGSLNSAISSAATAPGSSSGSGGGGFSGGGGGGGGGGGW